MCIYVCPSCIAEDNDTVLNYELLVVHEKHAYMQTHRLKMSMVVK